MATSGPVACHVRLTLFDVLGRQVATLLDRDMPAGRHAYRFVADRMPSGVYYVVMTAGSYQRTRSIVLLR